MNEFIVPANHIGFKAKKLLGKIEGTILDTAVAYIEPHGGGPEPSHTHFHDHLFIVIDGTANIKLGDEIVNVGADEAFLVKGSIVHSIWNKSDQVLKMIGISILPRE